MQHHPSARSTLFHAIKMTREINTFQRLVTCRAPKFDEVLVYTFHLQLLEFLISKFVASSLAPSLPFVVTRSSSSLRELRYPPKTQAFKEPADGADGEETGIMAIG
jgi:hypothetical protein